MDHNELLNNNHINKKVKICSILSLLFCLILGVNISIKLKNIFLQIKKKN